MSFFNLFTRLLYGAAFKGGVKVGTAIAKGLSGGGKTNKLTAKQLEDRRRIKNIYIGCVKVGMDPSNKAFYGMVTMWAEDNPSDFAREYLGAAVQSDASLRNAPEAVLLEVSRRIRTQPDAFRKALGEYINLLKHIEKNNPDMFAKIKAGHPH